MRQSQVLYCDKVWKSPTLGSQKFLLVVLAWVLTSYRVTLGVL